MLRGGSIATIAELGSVEYGSAVLIAARRASCSSGIDRRVDLQSAAAIHADAVLLDQLLLDVVEEVRLATRRVAADAGLQAERLRRRLLGLGDRDEVALGHVPQHLVAPFERRGRFRNRLYCDGACGARRSAPTRRG